MAKVKFMKIYFIFPLIFQKFIWLPTRLALIIFGRVKVNGLENLKNLSKPVIFACNHSSEMDPFMVPATLPFWSRFSPLFYTVREQSFYSNNGWRKYMFGGLFIKSWGGYTAVTGLRDYEKSLLPHIDIIQDGGSFCVFPEGSISKDGLLQPAKGGVAYLAYKGDCSIVPVAISGVYNMSMGDFFTRKRKIIVSYGKPITQDELQEMIARSIEPKGNVYKEESIYVMKRVGEMIIG